VTIFKPMLSADMGSISASVYDGQREKRGDCAAIISAKVAINLAGNPARIVRCRVESGEYATRARCLASLPARTIRQFPASSDRGQRVSQSPSLMTGGVGYDPEPRKASVYPASSLRLTLDAQNRTNGENEND
jgi:hypothetical protein